MNINSKRMYLIGFFAILFLFPIILYNILKKEEVYVLYDSYKNCKEVEEYKKKMHTYGMCLNYKTFFFDKKEEEKVRRIKSITYLKLTSKAVFFKRGFFKNKSIYLVVKTNKGYYNIIPVDVFSFVS